MNTDQGRLNIVSGIDNSRLRAEAAEANKLLRGIGQTATQQGQMMDNAFIKAAAAAGSFFAVGQVKEFINQIIRTRAEIQSLEVSFETLLGNKEKATEMFGALRKFAVETPMMLKDLAGGAQTMLAFNIEAEKVMPMLKSIGDISMGDAQKFNSLTLAFSQMSATGKLMGQDLLQMINAGFNPLSVMSEKTGKSIGDLKKEMEGGKISAEMVSDAFLAATSAGGKFNGMLEKQSHGIAGAQAKLSGAIDDMFNAIGKNSEDAIVNAYTVVGTLAENYEQVGRILMGLIGTYGVYRAALITVTTLKGWATAAEAVHYNWLLLVEKAQKMLNATMLSNPYVLIATLIAGVVAAMVSMKTEAEKLKDAEKAYEEQKQSVIDKERQHKEELDKLISVAGDEAVSTDIRRKALYQLEKKYPSVFAKYDTEFEKLQNIKEIKLEIAELDGQKSITKTANELDDVNKRIKELEAIKATLHEEWVDADASGVKMKKVKKGGLSPDQERELTVLKNKRTELEKKKRGEDVDAFFADLTGISDDTLANMIKRRKDLLAKIEMSGGKYNSGKIINEGNTLNGTYTKEELQAQLQMLQRQDNYRKAPSKTGAEWLAQYKKEYEDALKAYNDYVKGVTSKGVKQDEFKKESERLKGVLDTAKKNYEAHKPSENNSANRAADVARDNADKLASEAAKRIEQGNEYAKKVKAAAIANELEIEQARISAMEEGVEKELAQNELNYRRFKEQNRQRLEEMLDEEAQERVRIAQEQNPELFMRKNKDGKLEEIPGEREAMLRTVRASLTDADLSQAQQAQIKQFATLATQIYEKANSDSLDKMLKDVMTYTQSRAKIEEEFARRREQMYVVDKQGNKVLREGIKQGNVDELNRQEEEALAAVDNQFAQREDSYKAWCQSLANISLEQLKATLSEAEAALAALEQQSEDTADAQELATARAKVKTLRNKITETEAQNAASPGKRSIKEWQDLYKALLDTEREFESIGNTIGGTAGKIIALSGTIASSTLQMINGILTLTKGSIAAVQGSAVGASKAIKTVERASVILSIIGAAMQITMSIINAIKQDDTEKLQKELEEYQQRIDGIQWQLDNMNTVRVWETHGKAVERVNQAVAQTRLELYAAKNGLSSLNVLFVRASRNSELMSGAAAKLATAYANMSYTVDKAFGEKRYSSSREQLEQLSQQQILLMDRNKALGERKEKDEKQIEENARKIEELGQKALEVINNMVEEIIGGSATNIAEQLGEAFFAAFEAGEDAAKAWGDKVNDIVRDILKRMLIQKLLEGPVGAIFDKYKKKWFGDDGSFAGIDAVTASMSTFSSDLNGVLGPFEAVMNALPDEIKTQLIKNSERSASQGGIATASQESVDELNGRATAIQSHTYSISENTKLLLSTTQGILRSVMNIETETNGFGARLTRMENNLKAVAVSVDDIATKGIRLKN